MIQCSSQYHCYYLKKACKDFIVLIHGDRYSWSMKGEGSERESVCVCCDLPYSTSVVG